MIVLSNSLTDSADEGGLKLATSLVKRLENAYIVTYDRKSELSDEHLEINKFMLNRRLISIIRQKKQPVLYIPFPAPSFSMALRIFIVSLFARYGLRVVLVRQYPMSKLAKLLVKLSKAELVVFSGRAKEFYSKLVTNNINYLRTGVDTKKFLPVSEERTKQLKIKYGFDADRPLILHVGHMKDGRNVKELMKLDEKYQILLVVSTLSKERQNAELKEKLLSKPNIKIIDTYIPCIEEIYQMCDAYFFPVTEQGHCIDIPLSCMEAAACNKPVIATDYGEMREFVSKPYFYKITDFSQSALNALVQTALSDKNCNSREQVLEYDWDRAACILNEF